MFSASVVQEPVERGIEDLCRLCARQEARIRHLEKMIADMRALLKEWAVGDVRED